MDHNPLSICAAGNVEVPAYLVLAEKGYAVTAADRSAPGNEWTATKADAVFRAGSLIELLGLVSLVESRGPDWRADDKDIDAFLRRFEG